MRANFERTQLEAQSSGLLMNLSSGGSRGIAKIGDRELERREARGSRLRRKRVMRKKCSSGFVELNIALPKPLHQFLLAETSDTDRSHHAGAIGIHGNCCTGAVGIHAA